MVNIKKVLELHLKFLNNESEGSCADLSGADLRGADLRGANLFYANLPDFYIVPSEGMFTAFKKVLLDGLDVVIKIEISKKSKRMNSLVGRKCRTDRAKCLSVLIDGKWRRTKGMVFRSKHDSSFTYEIGKVSSVDNFDHDIRIECTTGIHFFMTLKEAQEY